MNVTINDVAKKAGVAVSTVSKVLKNYPNISQKTKDKVMDAVKELNYVPNSIASALSSKNYNKIALWININNKRQAIDEINMQYMFGAFNEAKKYGIELITIFSPLYENATVDEIIRDLKAQGVKGIIIYGLSKLNIELNKLVDMEIFKCVVVDAPNVNSVTTSVSVDHYSGQYEVAKKTITGHYCKKLLYITGGKEGYVTDMRIAGMKKLQKEFGFEMNIQYADFSEKKAYEITKKYGEEYDVIVCASDLMAIGAKHALIELDVFRPLCGYDGITLMAYAGEDMNTVKQDFYHVSQIAIDEMQRLLNGEYGHGILVDYEVTSLNYQDIIKETE